MNGGVIGKPNVPTPERASGVWRVGEVFDARAQNIWRGDFNPDFFDAGDPAAGGFFVGVIDTIANSGDIDPNDTRQNGLRYALIVSPRSIGQPSSNLRWRTSQSGVAEARTRWDGLYVTDFIIDGNAGSLSSFPIYDFCNDVRASDPPPDDGGSQWYIPAMDELELIHRVLKPGTDSIDTSSRDSDFPDGQYPDWGNPSSDPQGVSYATSPPTQTDVADFQTGGDEALDYDGDSRYWSASEANGGRAWNQHFRGSNAGIQNVPRKDSTSNRCRLVRRVLL